MKLVLEEVGVNIINIQKWFYYTYDYFLMGLYYWSIIPKTPIVGYYQRRTLLMPFFVNDKTKCLYKLSQLPNQSYANIALQNNLLKI